MPSHDVLIIGAGLAGQRAALAAARAGASVAILSKDAICNSAKQCCNEKLEHMQSNSGKVVTIY